MQVHMHRMQVHMHRMQVHMHRMQVHVHMYRMQVARKKWAVKEDEMKESYSCSCKWVGERQRVSQKSVNSKKSGQSKIFNSASYSM